MDIFQTTFHIINKHIKNISSDKTFLYCRSIPYMNFKHQDKILPSLKNLRFLVEIQKINIIIFYHMRPVHELMSKMSSS